jgi:tetratricopeptide (TPR) repeat protein
LARIIGDYHVAIKQFEACLIELSQRPGLEPVLRGPTLYNLALTKHYYTGHENEALQLCMDAVAEFKREGMNDYLRQALQNASWMAVAQNDLALAEALLQQAKPLCVTPEHHHRQELLLSYYYNAQGDEAQALAYIDHIHQEAKKQSVPLDVMSIGAAIAADIALTRGDIDTACSLASIAYDRAVKDGVDSRCWKFSANELSKVQHAKRNGA